MPLSAYAKRRGVSPEAVCKAVASARLERSIVIVRGKPKIADAELADKEWADNTRTARPPTPKVAPPPNDSSDELADGLDDAISYAEARRRREVELWRQARIKSEADALELGATKGDYIQVAEARATVIDAYTIVRTRLLGVPTRCKQRIAKLTIGDVAVIDDLVREALEELVEDDG